MSAQRRRDADDAADDGDHDAEENEQRHGEPRWIMQVVALYDYEPEERDELAFQEGDVIRVVRVQGDGWWHGYVVNAPRRLGVFPSNYVQVQHRRSPPDDDTPQRQRIQQQADPHVRFTVPRRNDDEDEGEEEDEADDGDASQPARIAPSAKTSSVLQLKQRLAEAERTSRAAQDARRKAEQEQLRRRQPQTVGVHRRQSPNKRVDRDDEEEDEEEDAEHGDDGFYTQEQWRQQQRQVEIQDEDEEREEGEEEEEEEEDKVHSRGRSMFKDGDHGAEEGEEEDEEADSGREDDEADHDDRSFAGRTGKSNGINESNGRRLVSADDESTAAARIARQYRSHRQQVQSRDADDRQRRDASQVIALSLRRNVQRSRERQQQQQRQSEAARAIQRWLVSRATSARDSARLSDESCENANDAARRIQRWVRQRQAYLKWLEHVEAERDEMIRRREAETLQRQREDEEERRRQQERDEEEAEEERARRSRQDEIMRQERAEEEKKKKETKKEERQIASIAASSDSVTKKEKKRVMKREAVDLVKTLVAQQLNEKLRDHDDQMMELQRMVARLHDVIRQQSEMIQQTTDDMLEQQQQSPSLTHTHTRHRQLKPSASSVSMEIPAAPTASSLPLIHQQQRPLPPVTTPTTGSSRPSGIKPPRHFERTTTKLPLLVPTPSTSTTSTTVHRSLKR